MPESPASPTPYEILGVSASMDQEELRRAYRRLLRETHPDTGGSATRFHALQLAWEQIGTRNDRAAYDAGRSTRAETSDSGFTWTASTSGSRERPERTSLRARSYGHPGGYAREHFLTLMREWAGRGATLEDPFDAALVRTAPREIRHWLAKALAEEATARTVSTLGIGYTVWNDVAASGVTVEPGPFAVSKVTTATPTAGDKIDHVVLGPAGLFAVQSEDWGSEVRLVKGEVVGDQLADREEPVRQLARNARKLGKSLGVRFTALAIVVPDDALADPIMAVERKRHANTVLLRRSLLAKVLRDGFSGGARTSMSEVFEVRTRLQNGIRFV